MLAPNTIIVARYKVVRSLGGGGMKLVYLAEDLRLASRLCALAEMVDSFTSPDLQKSAVDSFNREADMLATLSNEHIPRVFDRFSDSNHHYLVMEFIDGITLEEKLADSGSKLGESEVIDIAIQVLDTLIYLHGLTPPVIYRDLKPSNIMVTANGMAKLIDFGIARHFAPSRNATMIGTQGYAPPEQYRGRVETRSDLYALGATMHHALSGRDPAAEAPFSFPPLYSLSPMLAKPLCELIDQTLKYDVIMRPADALEFKQRLIAIRDRVPVSNVAVARSSAPQMKLPMRGVPRSAPSSPGAPTVVSLQAKCPRCDRVIPLDSNYCSFCAEHVTGRLSASSTDAAANARTIVLQDVADSSPPAEETPVPTRGVGRRRRLRMLTMLIIGGAIVGYYAIKPFIPPPEPDDGSVPDSAGVAPDDGIEPAVSQVRLHALRNWLDSSGYSDVHFKVSGSTLLLWGNVPTEADRMMVQGQAYMIGGFISFDDRITVRDTFAEP
jgi:serine/threonine-protein kinase